MASSRATVKEADKDLQRRHSPHPMADVDRSVSPAWHFAHDFNAATNAPSAASYSNNRPGFYTALPSWLQQSPTEGSASPQARHPFTSGLHPRAQDMAAQGPQRYPGDGLDYRRPAGLEATPLELSDEDADDDDRHIDLSMDDEEVVIDLTADDSGYGASLDERSDSRRWGNDAAPQNEPYDGRSRRPPRLPQGMDNIINLDNGDETWRRATPRPEPEPGSPEIEFISSRTIDPPRRPAPPVGYNADGDEVEFVSSNPLPEDEVQRRRDDEMRRILDLVGGANLAARGSYTHLQARVERSIARIHRTAPHLRRNPTVPPRGAPRSRGVVYGGFAAPLLDFDMVGFDLGFGAPRAPDPPAPTYKAPDKAPDGFTRSPQEEGHLICPNCEEELCVGDDEVKRQVWIVKTCGHVCAEILISFTANSSRYIVASARPTDPSNAAAKEKKGPQGPSPLKIVWSRTAGRGSRTRSRCSRSFCRQESITYTGVFSLMLDLVSYGFTRMGGTASTYPRTSRTYNRMPPSTDNCVILHSMGLRRRLLAFA